MTQKNVWLGIDIGQKGGIGAIVEEGGRVVSCDVWHMERFFMELEVGTRKVRKGKNAGATAKKIRHELNGQKIAGFFQQISTVGWPFVLIEKPQMRPAFMRGSENACPACGMEKGQGAASQANFIGQAREIRGILIGLDIPFEEIHPATWKKDVFHGQGGSDKDVARLKAQQMFPTLAEKFSRKKDDGVDEGILLADYCRRRRTGVV